MSRLSLRHLLRPPAWRQRSAWWVLAGGVSGAVVGGGVAAAVAVIDPEISGDGLDLSLALFAALFGGFWGGIGGLLSGCFCAAITWVLESRMGTVGPTAYGGVAAVMTFVLALMVTGFWAGPMIDLWHLAFWIVLPVAVSTVAAWLVGSWIWRRTHTTAAAPGRSLQNRAALLAVALLTVPGAAIAAEWLADTAPCSWNIPD